MSSGHLQSPKIYLPPGVRTQDYVCGIVFLIVWLLPVAWTGLTLKKISFLPRVVTYFHNIGNLFTYAVPVWPLPYIQAKQQGSDEWITLPEDEYFRLKTFGFRTRFFEALYFGTNIKD